MIKDENRVDQMRKKGSGLVADKQTEGNKPPGGKSHGKIKGGDSRAEKIITDRISESRISCSTMIVTLFGDVVSQHGGWIWLGSLINALSPLGYSERLVRTAVYRLMQSDWLQARRTGRKSYYCMTHSAIGHYEKAARRIYADGRPDWDGSWILVAPTLLSEAKREEFRKSLLWQGFNTLVTGMFAHPSSDTTSLDETIREQKLAGKVVVMSARTTDLQSREAIRKLVKGRWSFTGLKSSYTGFIRFFRPFAQPGFIDGVPPRELFQIRLLLIHEYRRILLRDPDFPDSMLPRGWAGREAQQLVKCLYMLLAEDTARYACNTLENAQGYIDKPSPGFYGRFGGAAQNK